MSEDRCETVEIISPDAPGGFIVINKSDYDPAVHEIFGSKQPEQVETKRGKR